MLAYNLKQLTLRDFYELRQADFGDLLDPLVFADKYRDGVWCALLTFELATFPGDDKPTKERFLESISGDDLSELRSRLFKAYRNFFPYRVRTALDAWQKKIEEIRARARATKELEPTVGAIEPSN